MNPLSSPSPDGFPAGFFQDHWSIVGQDIYEAVLAALNHNIWNNNINEIFIVLIPKTKNPTQVTEFRPISLCNVTYTHHA